MDSVLQLSEPYETDNEEDSLEVTPGGASNGSDEDGNLASPDEQEGYVFGASSVHPLAVEAAMEVLENDGNAVEAAIAMSFVLGVVEPYGSGIGGGGMMLVHEPGEGARSFDYREAAPASGQWPDGAVAVPGMVKGMEMLYENYGSGAEGLTWDHLLQPAIDHAREGVLVDRILSDRIDSASRYLSLDPAEREAFYPDGLAIGRHESLVQENLAQTLEKIQSEMAAGFYEGEVAQAMIDQVGFTAEDLQSYDVYEHSPAVGEFNGKTIYGAASPSAGITLIQMLQMAESLDLEEALAQSGEDAQAFAQLDLRENLESDEELTLGHLVNEPEWLPVYVHLISEITKAAYSDRLDTIGDPQFNPEIDMDQYTEKGYTDSLIENINFDRISYNEQYDSPASLKDARHTSHFVIVDKDGMMVSSTHSLGEFFGSGRNVSGMFLNNQLQNFSPREDSPNSFSPGKRPRTFVSPIIVEHESGKAELGLGSPGGRRIPAMLFQTMMQYTYGVHTERDERLTLQEAISRSRFYAEDNIVNIERELPEEIENIFMQDFRYNVSIQTSALYYGGIQGLGLEYDDNGNVQRIFGGGDPRRNGAWQLGTHEGTQEEQSAEDDEVEE